ncbi:MAG: DinB family protein [Dehalococcoidia bacterium]|nr:DinB family protein [Dehalococcoidia bacterium]
MATPDELRTQLESARAEFRKALEAAGSGWEQKPAGGEGEEAWSPRQVAEHAIGTETYFATSICKACGYPGVDPIETDFPTADVAVTAFDAAVEACNKKLKHVSAEDLAQSHDRLGSVENIFQMDISHMTDHAQQIRNAVGATA